MLTQARNVQPSINATKLRKRLLGRLDALAAIRLSHKLQEAVPSDIHALRPHLAKSRSSGGTRPYSIQAKQPSGTRVNASHSTKRSQPVYTKKCGWIPAVGLFGVRARHNTWRHQQHKNRKRMRALKCITVPPQSDTGDEHDEDEHGESQADEAKEMPRFKDDKGGDDDTKAKMNL